MIADLYVNSMANMFNNCFSLTFTDLTSFNKRNVYDMSHIFDRCSSLILKNKKIKKKVVFK